ncbi:acyltransferase [Paenibacillus naphthalenovorans]|uniref:acyltransferase n=1 Tax=Paenibacillus naphthalenovorans TaxID=162209 RepID=UPI003D277076
MRDLTKKWYIEIDLLRGIAIVMVLLIHTFALFTQIPKINLLAIVTSFIDIVSSIAVPMFVFISSVLMTLQKSYLNNYFMFIYHRLKFIIIPYLIFSLIYLVFYSYWNETPFPEWKLIASSLYNGGSAFHLYFIPIIVGLYIFYPISYSFVMWSSKKMTIIFPILTALLFQYIWIYQHLIISKIYPEILNLFIYPYISTFTSFLQVFVYFVLGIYVGANYDNIIGFLQKCKLKPYLITAILLSSIVTWEWLLGIKEYGNFYVIPAIIMIPTRLIMIVSHIFWFISLYKIIEPLLKTTNTLKTMISEVSRYSFGIFLIHIFYFEVLLKLFTKYHLTSTRPTFYILFFISMFILSYLSVKIISLVPFHQYVIGKIAKGKE